MMPDVTAPAPSVFRHPPLAGYALLDSGDARKLERFGEVVLDRPDPQALWRPREPVASWRSDLRFVRESDRGGRWEGRRAGLESWEVELEDATGSRGTRLVLRPTPFKHVGLFPEQAANWVWVRERGAELAGGAEPPRLLNLFGYTGAASIQALAAGFEVTHVDASKTSLAWLRENLRASGRPEDACRLVLEDALQFARREARRGARYEGVLLDPPHYGRGPKGRRWQFEEGMAPLLEAVGELLAERSFLVLSTYAIGYSPLAFENMLGELEGGVVSAGELALPEEGSERLLPCGFCARWVRGSEIATSSATEREEGSPAGGGGGGGIPSGDRRRGTPG